MKNNEKNSNLRRANRQSFGRILNNVVYPHARAFREAKTPARFRARPATNEKRERATAHGEYVVYQIRIHGRGGQGVVTAAEMLSVAAFTEGHWAQAFPSFGSERTGAPVVAFARIDEKEIRLREPIQEPDVVLVQDRTLLESEDVFGGIRPDGYVLINSSSTPEELGLGELIARLPKGHVQTVPATRFAIENIGRPLPGAGMLAGFAAMTGAITLENVQAAYNARFGGKIAEANAKVAQAAWDHVKAQLK